MVLGKPGRTLEDTHLVSRYKRAVERGRRKWGRVYEAMRSVEERWAVTAERPPLVL
jgi:hypothetical protein